MIKNVFFISSLYFIFLNITLHAQSIKNLEIQRSKLQNDIKKVEKILSKTKAKKNNALDDLKDLNQKIYFREKLIVTIEMETRQLSNEIKINQKKIDQNNSELEILKKDYRDMVFKSYKSRSQKSKTMFLLSSDSFLQAYKRLKYMDQYNKYRRKQGEEIIKKIQSIKQLNDSLSKRKKIKDQLIESKKQEKQKIETDKNHQVSLVSKIKKDESKYKRELKNKIHKEKQITLKIDKIIRNAIVKANKAKKSLKKDKLILTVEEKKLKDKFEQNKGILPSPLKDGVITRHFGIQKHPTFSKIKINSTGLHIRGKKGDFAKSVFNGKVLVVQILSKGRKSVFIQHGSYITVYNNLSEVYVKKGQNVKTGTKLGKIYTDKITGKTSLLFILSKNTKKLDPEAWININ